METAFGPPSEPIDIGAFLQSVEQSGVATVVSGTDDLRDLSQQKQYEVLAECSVSDIRKSLFDLWNDPRLSGHLLKEHQSVIASIHSHGKRTMKKRKVSAISTDQLPLEVTNMQKELQAVELNSWKSQPGSAVFMRTPRNTDYNVLKQPKALSNVKATEVTHAIVTASVYKKTDWNPGLVARISQHALLSSQTLGQLFDAIPCPSKEVPQQIIQDGKVIGYTENEAAAADGCVICIEGYAYGDGNSGSDYADKLMEHLRKMEKKKETLVRKAAISMRETEFRSLALRINQPYWLLHAGNCEHFIVFDQIRLRHESDPSGGYPLTLQITPLLLDVCRACGKVPAVRSIVNDARLSENPFLICAPCWRSMEDGKKEGVMVVPLPRRETGW